MTLRSRLIATVVVVSAGAFALSGCTADEPTPTPTPTAQGSTEDPGVTDIEDAPGSGENLEGALADSEVTTCERTDDTWTVDGTVTNPTEGTVDYRIYVSLLNGANDTRGLQQVNVDAVEAGATSEWESSIPIAEDDLTCVLRVERYAVAG
jgi:hypothetical protein